MSKRIETRATMDQLPRISQNLRLSCCQCRHRAMYDVGRVFYDQEAESRRYRHAFSNYFRCRSCGSAGPWEVVDMIRLLGLVLRWRVSRHFEGLVGGRCHLFDGTIVQTPAMGEDYLRGLIENDPDNPFLCSRLANLFRSCGQTSWAAEWDEKTLQLKPGDIEARNHLFLFAERSGDFPAALTHARLLVRGFRERQKTENPGLAEAIAANFAENLRSIPDESYMLFNEEFMKSPQDRETTFILSLLNAEGIEDDIIDVAVESLMNGTAETLPFSMAINRSAELIEPVIDLIASLKEVVVGEGLDSEELGLALEVDDEERIMLKDRRSVPLHDNEKAAFWEAPALREMFRGNLVPPSDEDMNRYHPEYCPYIFLIEDHVLMLCDKMGDRTDQELLEVYSMLRRRPDGRSLGLAHDFIWQAAALLLGKHALSQAQFEAIFGQLARSARRWARAPVSRNYVANLRQKFSGDAHAL